MPYLMGGHPSKEESLAAGEAAVAAGADLIELGVPFSDPLADGPVIHAAGTAALEAGITPGDVLEICAALAPRRPPNRGDRRGFRPARRTRRQFARKGRGQQTGHPA